jgi:phytanoyl-CoA hydroxylase
MTTLEPILESERNAYLENGYLVVSGLFTEKECDFWATYFTDMVERGGDGWAEGGVDPNHEDPLERYPRLLQPHRGDKVAFDYMVDQRINRYLTSFYDKEPLAVQTMVYFKPPGARGQALHQDNRYLQAEPGTCMAAWLALEDIDLENGCLEVVPGSQDMPMVCTEPADTSKSFSDGVINLPGMKTIPIEMKKGDVIFFNGSLVHGSGPNMSATRFRRIMVGHYIEGKSEQVAKYYFPVFRMDGSQVDGLTSIDKGGPCGVPVLENGKLTFKEQDRSAGITGPH